MSLVPSKPAFSLLPSAAVVVMLAGAAVGQDFRVDTEVFIGTEKEPAQESLTIFTGGRVYDFLHGEPEEVTILDPQRGQFTLLHVQRRVRATVSTQEVLNFVLDFDAQAAQSNDRLFSFAAAPQFDTVAEEIEQNGQPLVKITLAGKPLEYVALCQKPQRAEAVTAYRHFADWYARLNATRRGNLPPGARLALNQEIANRGLLPLEVGRTIVPANPLAKKVEVKSRHLVNWTLSGEDRKRVERAGNWMAEFEAVTFDEYRSRPAAGAPEKQARK